MAPKKKEAPSMIWVRKSQQSVNIATEKKTSSSMMPESSLLPECISKLQLSSSPSTKIEQPATKEQTLSLPDWSLLPEELLHIIYENLEDCFVVIHARSVCRPWRSTFPYPANLLRPRYSLPSFAKFPRKSKDLCTLEKVPLFLFRVRAAAASPSVYFLGGVNQDNSVGQIDRSSPLQCSVRVNIPGSDPTMMNILDCQILPLGYQYRMIGNDPQSLLTGYRGVAFLPLNKEGAREFVVLLGYCKDVLVLRSDEMRWMRLKKISEAQCKDVVTFRGRFYVLFLNKDLFVIDPYTLEATPLMPPEFLNSLNYGSVNYLVPCGDDDLFLIQKIIPRNDDVLRLHRLACRVNRLDDETGEWVEVSDLGDRVLFIGDLGSCYCSAKELLDGYGVSGNSFLFTHSPGGYKVYAYKYGAPTDNTEDDLSFWRYSRENSVTLLNTKLPVVALRIDC